MRLLSLVFILPFGLSMATTTIVGQNVGADSLAYGLVAVGLVNVWASAHYFRGARTLREDLDTTERLSKSGDSIRI